MRGTGRSLESYRKRRLVRNLALAGAAVGLPLAAAALLRRRAEPPSPPRWGRAHRYAGRWSELVFQELGSGPPLLLLHAFGPGYGTHQWRNAAEILAADHCVYVPDLPGWGRTRGLTGARLQERYLTLIEDFLGGVIREKAVIVAAGLSAAYAVRAAADHPGRVRALALVSPQGLEECDAAQPGGAVVANLLRVPGVSQLALDLLTGRAALDHHLRREIYAAPERVDAALLDHHHRNSHTSQSRAAFAAYLRGDLWLDVTEDLSELQIPIWLAWGRQAKTPPVDHADLWVRRLPKAQVEVFQGAGALPHAETPALFCKALERFLAGLPE